MALTYSRRRLSSTAREKLYDRCCGNNKFPICNLCPLPILPGQEWDESHEGAPHALGGTETGIAHRKCNREHGARVVTPMVAKAKRGRKKHIGAWVARHPMQGGRASGISKKMNGEVVARKTRAEKLALPAKYRAATDTYDAMIEAVATEMRQS